MIDIEAVNETAAGTPFHRVVSLLIGIVAVLAAILAVAQVDLSQKESRTLLQAARVSASIFEGIAASGQRSSFTLNSQQDAIAVNIASLARSLAALERGTVDIPGDTERVAADMAATDRLQVIAESMGAPAPDAVPLDAAARQAINAEPETLGARVTQQNVLVDQANEYGSRGGRSLLALSFVALAGVLLGLAATLGPGQAGRLALATAATTVLLASGTSVTILL